jgi:hypothetical protein
MPNPEVIRLGERELAKKRRRETRDANFVPVAQLFVELVQEALDKGESCSIVAWEYEGNIGGQLFEVTDCNPIGRACQIRNKALGISSILEIPEGQTPQTISAAFIHNNDGAGGRSQVWPYVGAWRAKIINRLGREQIKPKRDTVLSFHFMDVRSVNGARIMGE